MNDLQAEVQKKRAEELRQQSLLEEQDRYYHAQLKPAMILAKEYLEELVGNLNIVEPDIRPNYPINPLERAGVSLKQLNYSFSYDHGTHPRQIDVLCHCLLEGHYEFYVPTAEAVLRYADLLDNYHYAYHRKNKLDDRYNIRGATFILEGPMRVHISISALAAKKAIQIRLQNLEPQPIKKYRFSPESVDENLLDRLARLLIREESKLVEFKLGEVAREKLQQRLKEESLQKEKDLVQALAYVEGEKVPAEEMKLIMRTWQGLSRAGEEALKIILKVSKKSLFRNDRQCP